MQTSQQSAQYATDYMYRAYGECMKMTAKEFEKLNEKQANEIKSLKIRLKDVKNVSTTEIQTIIEVPVTITDTVKQCFEYKDAYVDINGCLVDSIKVESKDTITVVNHIIPKKYYG